MEKRGRGVANWSRGRLPVGMSPGRARSDLWKGAGLAAWLPAKVEVRTKKEAGQVNRTASTWLPAPRRPARASSIVNRQGS